MRTERVCVAYSVCKFVSTETDAYNSRTEGAIVSNGYGRRRPWAGERQGWGCLRNARLGGQKGQYLIELFTINRKQAISSILSTAAQRLSM